MNESTETGKDGFSKSLGEFFDLVNEVSGAVFGKLSKSIGLSIPRTALLVLLTIIAIARLGANIISFDFQEVIIAVVFVVFGWMLRPAFDRLKNKITIKIKKEDEVE